MNHTKGEWKVMHRNCNELQATFHGVAIGNTFVEISTQNSLSDCHLIAAAPDLLSMLEFACETLDDLLECLSEEQANDVYKIKEIENLLKKARGGL